jgi:hypothetical protein
VGWGQEGACGGRRVQLWAEGYKVSAPRHNRTFGGHLSAGHSLIGVSVPTPPLQTSSLPWLGGLFWEQEWPPHGFPAGLTQGGGEYRDSGVTQGWEQGCNSSLPLLCEPPGWVWGLETHTCRSVCVTVWGH